MTNAPRPLFEGSTGTAGIRHLVREDLPEVAALYEFVARSGSRTPPPGLVGHFASTFLDHPWADPDIPSLVYEEEDGSISGFIGCHVRRFLFDDTPVRLACGGQLVTDPTARNRAIGFFLLREFLAGKQDLAITDTAVDATRVMWTRIGGQLAHLQAISWFRLLRPVPFTVGYVLTRARRAATSSTTTGASMGGWPELGRITGRSAPVLNSAPLQPSELARLLPEVSEALRLRPDYDRTFLEWLFGEMAAVRSRGSLIARVVRAADMRIVGWYVYYLRRGGISDVLQIVASSRGVDRVVDDLFDHARSHGAALVRGRLEPALVEAFGRRRCVFRYNGAALIHSHNPDISRAINAGEALLTRMDGEWWMGHHLEDFRYS